VFELAKNALIRFLHPLYRALCQRNRNAATAQECQLIVQASRSMAQREANADISGIVFSMDRAMQLHALLGSYSDHVVNGPKLTVIYRVTSEAHGKSYEDVFAEFTDLIQVAIRQETREAFRGIVVDTLSHTQTKNVFFLVDDNLLIEPVNLGELAPHATGFSIPTLRLGENLSRSYTVQQPQAKPQFMEYVAQSDDKKSPIDMLSWCWKDGELDWGYPLSVDGHIFQRHELLAMSESIEFDSPNTFEGNLQLFNAAYQWRTGICFRKSRLINIPYNRVQTDYENIHGEMHQDEMLELWSEGFRIDRKSYYGVHNESAHQEIPLRLIKEELK
jgi:hypothetical protein